MTPQFKVPTRVLVLAHTDHRRTNVHGCVALDQAEVDVGHDHAGVQRGRRLVETAKGLVVVQGHDLLLRLRRHLDGGCLALTPT